MSAVKTLTELPPFRRAVAALVTAVDSLPEDELTKVLATEVSRVPTLSQEPETDLDDARRAFATLYEIAELDGVEEVLADLDASDIDLGSARPVIGRVLEPSEAISDRVDGRRQRDAMIPNLNDVRLSADFRVVTLSGGDLLAPVITARFGFDEAVGGSSAVAFQIGLGQVDALIDGLRDTRETIRRLSTEADALRVAEWAQVESS